MIKQEKKQQRIYDLFTRQNQAPHTPQKIPK